MTWTRLPDNFTDRPEVLGLSRSARLLHVEGLVWCNRLLTDGVISTRSLRRISDSDEVELDVKELESAGLWTRLDGKDAWQLDWSDQESAATVEQRRHDRNERQRRYNERRRRHASNDHSMCDPRFCPRRRNASADVSLDASDDGLPTRPDPSRPDPVGEGQGQGGSAADSATAPSARHPQRTSDGWLAEIDDLMLDALPWTDVPCSCPHLHDGLRRGQDDPLVCLRCSLIYSEAPFRFVGGAIHVPDYHERYPAELWRELLRLDPQGATLALDIACVIAHRASGSVDARSVQIIAEHIYRDRMNDIAWAEAHALIATPDN